MTRLAVPAAPIRRLHAVPPVAAPRMRDRVPAQALIEQVLQAQVEQRPRTALERAVGVEPLGSEARPWFTGALGERAVAEALSGLPEGWTVFHSVPVGRMGADIDHLVVGPGGVFTIDAKHHRGARVWVGARTMLVGGQRVHHLTKALKQASRVDRVVAAVLPDSPAVRPVVALVGVERLTVRGGGAEGVEVLRAESLRRALLRQPQRLAPEQAAALVERFDDARTWQPAAEAGPELLLRFAALARERRAAQRIRAGWTAGLSLLTATGVALAAPDVLHALFH